MSIRRGILALALACGVAGAQTSDPGLYLFQIPTTRGDGAASPLGPVLEANLNVPDGDALVDRLADTDVTVLGVHGTSIRIAVDEHETLSGEPHAAHLGPTFVVDFDEPPLTKLARKLIDLYGEAPSVDDLIDFVDDTIEEKTYRNLMLRSRS